MSLDQARTPTGPGGWRPGAGRPRGRKTVSHDARERFAARYPLHVTLRVVAGVRSLRRDDVMEIMRGVIEACGRTESATRATVVGDVVRGRRGRSRRDAAVAPPRRRYGDVGSKSSMAEKRPRLEATTVTTPVSTSMVARVASRLTA